MSIEILFSEARTAAPWTEFRAQSFETHFARIGVLPMGMPQAQPHLDPGSFLAWEAEQSDRWEFVDGEVFAMTGARATHNRIAGNVYAFLHGALKGKACEPFMSDMKLHVASLGDYFYPDVFVTCDPRDRSAEAELFKQHACLVVEVLSDSTAAYDHGRKFHGYRALASLQEYLLIEQERRSANLFRRNAEGFWVLHPHEGSDEVHLDSLGLSLALDTVYDTIVVNDSTRSVQT